MTIFFLLTSEISLYRTIKSNLTNTVNWYDSSSDLSFSPGDIIIAAPYKIYEGSGGPVRAMAIHAAAAAATAAEVSNGAVLAILTLLIKSFHD